MMITVKENEILHVSVDFLRFYCTLCNNKKNQKTVTFGGADAEQLGDICFFNVPPFSALFLTQ